MTEAYTEASGLMINSGEWNGMGSSVLKQEAPVMIEKMRYGRKTTNYKLRDWVFSRQRYVDSKIKKRSEINCQVPLSKRFMSRVRSLTL